eukprot:CAMPEP_0172830022 /NCGR_PEP_ID=MMETSP1075-20121228/21947_1 /TAXON_ID=2916 /ORGANISM="Ceratium fusus, Strain PA161109" /LENGTH=194 /DNA_ID=CAMNT_0013672249 /DNA_START=465 /DNA_END=1047 /DNA_ORIENTATION=+
MRGGIWLVVLQLGGGKCRTQPSAEAGATPAGTAAKVAPGLPASTKEAGGQRAVAAGNSQLMPHAPGASDGTALCDGTCDTCAPGMSTDERPYRAADARRAPGMSNGNALGESAGGNCADFALDVSICKTSAVGTHAKSGPVEVSLAKIALGRKRLPAQQWVGSCGFGFSCSRRLSPLIRELPTCPLKDEAAGSH